MLRGRPQLVFLDLCQQESERAFDDRARVAVRNLSAKELLKAAKGVVAALADRELDAIALGTSTASWFRSVSAGLSSRTDVRVTAPEASASRTMGNRRQVRAAVMRLHAASSDRPRAWVQ
jgi:hypothetical protein